MQETANDAQLKKLHIKTYGCQMNEADTEVVASIMRMDGYTMVDEENEADTVLLNTCSVRDNAEQKVLSHLQQLQTVKKKRGGRMVIGVIGCMAERMKDELIDKYGVDVVAGPDSYMDMPNLVGAAEKGERAINVELSKTETYKDVVPARIGNPLSGYISIMRGTPLMLQLLVVFFGPYYLFGIKVTATYRFYAVIIGFALNYAAYFAEIYRAGIESIPKGQYEAAAVLGYSRIQTFWKIIFPQMVKRVLPPVTNEVITLVKDTSLAFALAYTEMFTLAKQVAASMASIMPLFIAGLFYYIFNFVVAMVMEQIEKRMQYFD